MKMLCFCWRKSTRLKEITPPKPKVKGNGLRILSSIIIFSMGNVSPMRSLWKGLWLRMLILGIKHKFKFKAKMGSKKWKAQPRDSNQLKKHMIKKLFMKILWEDKNSSILIKGKDLNKILLISLKDWKIKNISSNRKKLTLFKITKIESGLWRRKLLKIAQ